MQGGRDMLDAEYRRSVAAVRGETDSPEERRAAGRDASLEAAARVAKAASESVEAERAGAAPAGEGARRFGVRTARWVRRIFRRRDAPKN